MIALALLLAQATPANPYAKWTNHKLVLVVNGLPVVLDYPTAERCETARRAAEAEAQRRWEADQSRQPAGTVLTKPAITVAGLCIPG